MKRKNRGKHMNDQVGKGQRWNWWGKESKCQNENKNQSANQPTNHD